MVTRELITGFCQPGITGWLLQCPTVMKVVVISDVFTSVTGKKVTALRRHPITRAMCLLMSVGVWYHLHSTEAVVPLY